MASRKRNNCLSPCVVAPACRHMTSVALAPVKYQPLSKCLWESRTDEQHPAQEESGLHVKTHNSFQFKYISKHQQTLPCPLGSRRRPCRRGRVRGCACVTAAVRGAAAAGDRAALTRHGQVQPPGPTAASAMPALQRPCLPVDIRPRPLYLRT